MTIFTQHKVLWLIIGMKFECCFEYGIYIFSMHFIWNLQGRFIRMKKVEKKAASFRKETMLRLTKKEN